MFKDIKPERYIASVSFGKDSLAMLLRLIEENKPLDEVVFYDTGMEFKAIYNIRDKVKQLLNDILKKCVESGITKININSDIQDAWSIAIKKYISENSNVIDPRKIIGSGFEAIKGVVDSKININE